MSTLTVLKEYLLGKDGDMGYLLNPDNNGKTVMLSGAWGSGKTHFWQKSIEEDLTKALNKKDKACVYVSLYGKDNIDAIKNEILFKAYESIKDENKLAKRAISAFGFGSRLLSVSVGGVRANTGAVGDAVEGFFESKKIDEAESFLADGGLICLDDFERKSKHIDLNDLFGFIAQLAIDMNCKIVIILNSDVFEGEEANIFKTVKEKTVNKFFYFKPERRELFDSIYDRTDNKYEDLDAYREDIFSAIDETEELNARIYMQVLDNCLEWIYNRYDPFSLRVLVLTNINFLLNHNLLSYPSSIKISLPIRTSIKQFSIAAYSNIAFSDVIQVFMYEYKQKKLDTSSISRLFSRFYREQYLNLKSEDYQRVLEELDQNEHEIKSIIKYGYSLWYLNQISQKKYKEIVNFVRTGILLKKVEDLS